MEKQENIQWQTKNKIINVHESIRPCSHRTYASLPHVRAGFTRMGVHKVFHSSLRGQSLASQLGRSSFAGEVLHPN